MSNPQQLNENRSSSTSTSPAFVNSEQLSPSAADKLNKSLLNKFNQHTNYDSENQCEKADKNSKTYKQCARVPIISTKNALEIEISNTLTNGLEEEADAASLEDVNLESNNSNNNNNNYLLPPPPPATTTTNRNMIIYYGRELIYILALILTTYATYQNVSPKISKVAPPKPFFPRGSLVHDYPTGHLDHVQNRVSQSELSLVMFYAPWCAESQHARSSYEYVAKLFYREAHFAAINCWQPGGECRHQYSKVMEWPVLMAYLQNGLAVPYTGKFTSSALTKFVQSLVQPLKRITSTDDLLGLMMLHDAVVVSFININRHPIHYKVLYHTAVKWLEKDPFQNVAFAVVTGESWDGFGVESSPVFRMYLWNGTVEYSNTTWTQSALQAWVSKNIIQVASWLSPSGSKSSSLAPNLKQGPVLMLFTPRNMQSESNDAYLLLRQIALEYENCPSVNHEWIKQMSRIYITDRRVQNQKSNEELQRQCEVHRNLLDPRECFHKGNTQNQHQVSVTFGNILNVSKSSTEKNVCQIGSKNLNSVFDETCANTIPTIQTNDIYEDSTDTFKSAHPLSMFTGEFDNRAAKNLKKTLFQKNCEILFSLHSEASEATFFPDIQDDRINFDKILGLNCKLNRTLSFIAIDSVMYHTFAERLGVDVLTRPFKTAVIIMDHENESTFEMKETLTTNNLINFIYNFSSRKLIRHLKTTNNLSPNYNYSNREPIVPKSRHILLPDISSSEFNEMVLLSNKTVIVLFYSIQCALCSIVSQSVMMASKILYDLNNLNFVRIDGDRNDLPFQYTMDKFPSLIAFPETGKSESRIYPITLEVNVQNVLGFVLANLNRPNRLNGLVLVCKNIKKVFLVEDCLIVLRRDIIDNISFSLQQWRNIPHQRSQILRRLQALQRFYLHLFRIENSCDFNSLDQYLKEIKKVWTNV